VAVVAIPPPVEPRSPPPPRGPAEPASRVRRPVDWTPVAPRPTRPRVSFGSMRGLHRLLQRTPLWEAVAAGLESSRAFYGAFTAAERAAKSRLFGCRMCGQCALPTTAYACPMTCPKQLRNGPCGGVSPDGSCEVFPGTRCVWLIAYERAEQDGHVSDLRRLQRPIDQRKWGQSSWVNYWRGRDDGLWTEATGRGRSLELPILPSVAER
jgi:Methylene-tetrahydrofolate reductase C terminal